MDSEQRDYVTLSKVCEDLGVTPAHLREILARFGDIIGLTAEESGAGRDDGSPPWTELLEEDWRPGVRAESPQPEGDGGCPEGAAMEGAGPASEAGDSLAAGGPGAAALPADSVAAIATILKMRAEGATDDEVREAFSPGAQAGRTADRVEMTLQRLARELAQTEKRRAEDRDRLLTALMRTHQEVRQLRNELAAQSSRKARKNKSFLSRLFGV
ncbi:MAG: hypothetical protein ACM3X4_05710 [Ignavibacteriales bacterium]